jgi:hypothetical protein
MSTKDLVYLQKGNDITFYVDGVAHVVSEDHINHTAIMKLFEAGDHDGLVELLAKKNTDFGSGIELRGESIFFHDRKLPDSLSKRWLKMHKAGMSLTALNAFVNNLYSNPSRVAVEELDLFLMANNLPLTADGHFVAFKRVAIWEDDSEPLVISKIMDGTFVDQHGVSHDPSTLVENPDGTVSVIEPDTDDDDDVKFVDCYTGEVDNSVGMHVSMHRNDVNDDRNITCSTGLHFCSLGYLNASNYGGENGTVIVMVKINPKDVVSIPRDYNNTKGRCCAYEVLAVYEGDKTDSSELDNKLVVLTSTSPDDRLGDGELGEYANLDDLVEKQEDLFGLS